MSHADEFALYLDDRRAWAEYVAPNWRRMLSELTGEAKAALWAMAGDELRAALQALKAAA